MKSLYGNRFVPKTTSIVQTETVATANGPADVRIVSKPASLFGADAPTVGELFGDFYVGKL